MGLIVFTGPFTCLRPDQQDGVPVSHTANANGSRFRSFGRAVASPRVVLPCRDEFAVLLPLDTSHPACVVSGRAADWHGVGLGY